MHKRNSAITALLLAAIITGAFLLFPRLYHGALGWLYLQNIAIHNDYNVGSSGDYYYKPS